MAAGLPNGFPNFNRGLLTCLEQLFLNFIDRLIS